MMTTDMIAPEKVWQELAEFKTTFDGFIRAQRDSSERDRRKYFESLEGYKGTELFYVICYLF